jgi:hypothetical protein
MCWTRNYDGGRGSWEAIKDRGVAVCRRAGWYGCRRVFRCSWHVGGAASEVGARRVGGNVVVVDVRSTPLICLLGG